MSDTVKLPEPVDYQIRLACGRWTHCAKHIHEAAIKSGAAETRALHSADQMISFRAADNAALREHQKATPLCDKHKPSGGTRGMCVICAGEALQAALSRISYACGEPNEMGCSDYDVHMSEDAVVDQVKAMRERVKVLEDALGEYIAAADNTITCNDKDMTTAMLRFGDADKAARAALEASK